METEHTPTPWKRNKFPTPEGTVNITDMSDNTTVIKCSNHFGNAEANAAFIVRAVNNHQSLLDACKEADLILRTSGLSFIRLEQAIAKAEGK